MPSIYCSCGRQIEVREDQAGAVVRCQCGLELTVPDPPALRPPAPVVESAETAAFDSQELEIEATKPGTASERRFLVFLTHPQELPHRISFDAASHFVNACDRLLQRYFAAPEHQWDVDLQVAVALLPNGKTLVEIQAQPAILPDQAADELADQLRALVSPPVADGPVAFAIRRPVCGGSPSALDFDIPFRSIAGKSGDLEQSLLESAGLAPPPTPSPPSNWLTRIRSRITSYLRRSPPAAPPPDSVEQPPLSYEDQEIATAIESGSIEQVEACLQRFPDARSLHHCLGSLLISEGRSQDAVAAYSRLLQLDPDNLAAYAARGRAYCMAGSMQNGLADYTKAIDGDPEDAESRAARAMLYLELEAWEIAEADLSSAILLAPIQPQLYVERARTRYAQQKTTDAQGDLRTALGLDPYYVDAHMLSGWILQHLPDATLQDIVDAAQFYSQAIEVEPDNPAYLMQRAEAYASQSKYALTIADCDRVLSLDGNNAVAYGIRGYAHQQLDNLPEAVTDCTKAIELGLQSAAVYVSRAVGYAAIGEVDLALVDCDAAIELAPDYAAAFNYRGMLKLGQGDAEAATLDFVEACRLAPTWSTPREYRADAHRLQSEFEQAIDQYTRTLELEPNNLTAYVGRALAWIEKQDFDKAWTDLTQAISIDEECVPAYFHRAELSMRRDQFEQALEDLDLAIKLDASFAPAYHARAQTYLQLQRNEEAIRDFSQLIELHPTWPGAYIGRANAWIHLGDAHQASEDYREAANLDPGSTEELRIHRLLVEAHHLHKQEEYEAAISKASEALELDDRSLPGLATRAVSYWYSEHFVEAAEDYSQLLKLEDDAPFAYAGRGQVYVELGEYELAMADLDKAVDMERQATSETGLAYALSGRALARAGLQRFDEAQQDFEESVQLRPDNAWVHYNQGLVYRLLNELNQAAKSFRRALEMTDPQLTKRKRERAEAFLQQHGA